MNQVLDKISKALKLGTNNTNENEAQSAILAAQRLMAKYHITQEVVEDFISENDKKTSEVIEEKAEREINNEKWKRRLMVVIARNFRCDVYYLAKKLIIVGEKEDILISKRIFLYAKEVILNNFKKYFKQNYESFPNNETFRNRCKRDFAYGFIDGLLQKFESQKENSQMAMVVVNPNVKLYLKNIKFNGVFHNRSLTIRHSDCYYEGKTKGRNLADIDTEMEGRT